MKIGIQIVNIVLVVMLLIATTGATMHKHYCMGRLQTVSYFEAQGKCLEGDEENLPCCDDTSELVKVDQLEKTQFKIEWKANLSLFTIAYYLFPDLTLSTSSDFHASIEYAPPLTTRDVPVWTQTFLI